MTTLLIDDELGAQARRAAEAQGKSLDQFVGEVLREAVAAAGVRCIVRNGLPVMQVAPPMSIDPHAIRFALDEGL
jgi:hypothetical protein